MLWTFTHLQDISNITTLTITTKFASADLKPEAATDASAIGAWHNGISYGWAGGNQCAHSAGNTSRTSRWLSGMMGVMEKLRGRNGSWLEGARCGAIGNGNGAELWTWIWEKHLANLEHHLSTVSTTKKKEKNIPFKITKIMMNDFSIFLGLLYISIHFLSSNVYCMLICWNV